MKKHEYLLREDYYESKSVKKGRIQKTCEHCGKTIPIGSPAYTHTFYPEFQGYNTHLECFKLFIESLRLPEDPPYDEEAEELEEELEKIRQIIKE